MRTICIVVAIILFVLAGIGIKVGDINSGWIGLAFFAGSFLVGSFKRLD